MTFGSRWLRRWSVLALFCALGAFASPLHAQSSSSSSSGQNWFIAFFSSWDLRALRAQVDQPNWLTPVVTSTARLKQEIRYDMSWQSAGDGPVTAANYGGSKGFTTIPIDRVEVSINPPPYVVHGGSTARDGFGDFSILTKLRLFAASRSHGDYALTLFLNTSIPTGSYKNGSPHSVLTPTIAGGKGLGDFVYQGTFGADLPSSQGSILGRRMIWNNALQYRGFGKLQPEMEVSSNFFKGGPSDGRSQVYLAPGISAGRFAIHGHVTLTIGAGYEIAATHFHSFEHQGIFSVRLPF
jgi:hypothetical protein